MPLHKTDNPFSNFSIGFFNDGGGPDVPGNELRDTEAPRNFLRDTDGNLLSDTEIP